MEFRYLTPVIFLFSIAFNLQAGNQQLHIKGSNTVGAQLAPELVQAWLKEKGYDLNKGSEQR